MLWRVRKNHSAARIRNEFEEKIPELPLKSDPDPKKNIPDPQH
jgi:hypothetical protein